MPTHTEGPRATPGSTTPGDVSRARLIVACAVLLAAYVALAAAGDIRAWSASDPGGKLATIEALAEGGWTSVDIGYWAADADPEGDLHPVLNTERQGDAWVQATPPLFAYPAALLFRVAGIPGVLLLVFASGVVAALSARRIALFLATTSEPDGDARPRTARSGEDDTGHRRDERQAGQAGDRRDVVARQAGWAAFWLIGLGPVTVHYVADVWEHVPALGLSLAGLALAATPLVERRPMSVQRAMAIGLLLGSACAMRREVAVWFVALAVAGLVTPTLRRCWTWRTAAAGAIAAGAVVVANVALEGWLSPSTSSGTRAAAQTSKVGLLDSRGDDAWLSSLAVDPRLDRPAVAVSMLVVVGLVLLGVAATRRLGSKANRATVLCGGAAVVVGYAATATKLLLIPGAIPSQPITAAAIGARGAAQRGFAVAAIAPWPVVWLIQWRGGMAFQFGGRYLMVGSALLVIVGAASISREGWRRPAAVALVATTAAVTVWSAAVHIERSRVLAAAGSEVAEQTDGDIVALAFPFGRDTVAVRSDDARWLQTIGTDQLERAIEIARADGTDEIVVVTRAGSRAKLPTETLVADAEIGSSPVPDAQVIGVSEVDYLRGDRLRIVRLQLT